MNLLFIQNENGTQEVATTTTPDVVKENVTV